MATKHIAIDTETGLIGAGQIAPPLVCFTWAYICHGHTDVTVKITTPHEQTTDGKNYLYTILKASFEDPETVIVGANLAFDLVVIGNRYPELWPSIFKLLDDERAQDVQIREKLLNLSTFGNMERYQLPDESWKDFEYSLAALAFSYLGKERFKEKNDPNSWRLRYIELIDTPLNQWPQEAKDYALNDARDTLLIYYRQAEKTNPGAGEGSVNTAAFQVAVNTALFLDTCWGIATDPARVVELERHLDERLKPERFKALFDAEILRPAVAPKFKKDGTTTKGKAESVNTTVLKARVKALCDKLFIEPKLTESGEISTDAEVIETLSPHDELIALYADRQEVIKIRGQYLPIVKNPIVYPNYNVLVNTGRTSSYSGGRGGKPALYPSTNIQNQPRIGGDFSVRECFIARPGKVFCSSDYSALELCTLGQVTYGLFGQSVHRDKINAGYDLHSYLGAHICLLLDGDFRKSMEDVNRDMSSDELYQHFMALKKTDLKKYKHFRTFAKPTGLGYPGGLGPDTFVSYAKATYGVNVDRETAELLRQVWFNTYPEMRLYFDWVNQQKIFSGENKFAYTSPMGMYRNNCSFCECANGKALQTPAAEGAKLGVFAVTRAMYDPSVGSILYGARRVAFVHDEQILEFDEENSHEKALELSRIMVEAMRVVCPDINIKAEPALMRRWYKDAEPTFDASGKLIPWEPQPKQLQQQVTT